MTSRGGNLLNPLFAFFMLVFCCASLKSQILFNNGALVHIDTATTMQVNGGFQDDNLIGGPGTWINDGKMTITSNGSWPGNVYISNNAVLQGNGKYHITQDWINDATFNAGNSTVDMYGDLKQLITSNNGTVTTFDTLLLRGTGANMNRRKQQTLDVNVAGALLLNDRVLFTAGHTMFITTPNIAAITNDTTYQGEGFVSGTGAGSLSRVTDANSSYFFPVGADSIMLRYRKVLITPASPNSNTFAVRLANNDATNNGDSIGLLDTSLCKVNPLFYHLINHTVGIDSADIDIYYDKKSDGPWYQIAQWNTPALNIWNNIGAVTNANIAHYSHVLKKNWTNFSSNAFILGAPVLKASISGKTSICYGGAVTLNASGGLSYLWSTGDTASSVSVSPASTAKYFVTISNGECSVRDSTTVIVNPMPTPAVCCDTAIIAGEKVQLIASGGQSYSWFPAKGLSCNNCPAPLANPKQTTTYTILVTSDSGCSAIDSVTIHVSCRPVSVCCDSVIAHDENVQLSSSGGSSYLWIPSAGLICDSCSNPIASPSQTTTYTVAINDSGCISLRTITIDVGCGDVFIPNVFSPNQEYNTIFYVRGSCIASMNFLVFDRWGNKVFESDNLNNGWDGTLRGQPMNMGTYIWYLKAILQDGTSIEKKGNVTLVR